MAVVYVTLKVDVPGVVQEGVVEILDNASFTVTPSDSDTVPIEVTVIAYSENVNI
jgi:hypothetical protein